MYCNGSDTAKGVNQTDYTITTEDHPPHYLSLLLFSIVIFTVFGNLLVIVAVSRFRKLRTVTNTMILSLALSDLLIGILVMPFNISNDTLHYWPYGQTMCHLYHSFDVLGSTASILNLCMISLDRFWAVTNPIAYPRLMSRRRGLICISVVWVCSAAISFPVIAWWYKVDVVVPQQCNFTQDTVYLVLSSMISFYIPVLVMVVVYTRIFIVIKDQSKQYALASSYAHRRLSGCQLRAHRGGMPRNESNQVITNPAVAEYERNTETKLSNVGAEDRRFIDGRLVDSSAQDTEEESNQLKRLLTRINMSVITSKKSISGLSNEFRVARTLGIVLSIFLICWLPFFVCNFMYAVCKNCIKSELVFKVVTWLGHVNSCINPVIYALSMKNMREAFIKILCCCRRSHKKSNSLDTQILNGTFSVIAAPASLRMQNSRPARNKS